MIQAFLVTALVFCLPFLVFPFGVSFFETPKVIAFEAGVSLLLLVTIWQGNFSKFRFQNTLPFLLFFLFTLVTLLIHPDLQSFFGNIFRLQGIFLLWNLMLFAYLSSAVNIDKKGIFYFILLGLLLTLALIGYILGVAQNGRAVGSLGEPNSLGSVAVFFLPFIFLKQSWKYFAVGLLICLETILLAGSRGGLFALFLTLTFLFLSKSTILGVKKASILTVLILLIGFSLPLIEGGGWFENRSEIWETAYYAGWQSPIIGNGFGNIQNSISEAAQKLNNNVQYQIVDSAHNIFLDFWVQGGAIGLLFFFSILAISFYNFIASKNRLMIALLLGLLASLIFNPLSVSVLIMFWWVIGKGIFISSLKNGV